MNSLNYTLQYKLISVIISPKYRKYHKVTKNTTKLPKIPQSYQKYHKVTQNTTKLPTKLPKIPRSYQTVTHHKVPYMQTKMDFAVAIPNFRFLVYIHKIWDMT